MPTLWQYCRCAAAELICARPAVPGKIGSGGRGDLVVLGRWVQQGFGCSSCATCCVFSSVHFSGVS